MTLDDAKLEADLPHLLILDTKFGKSRVVVLHQSTVDHLRTYVAARTAALRGRAAAAFFTTLLGRRLNYTSTGVTFRRLLHHAGIQAAPGQRVPSLHSFRHHADCRIMPTTGSASSSQQSFPGSSASPPVVNAA